MSVSLVDFLEVRQFEHDAADVPWQWLIPILFNQNVTTVAVRDAGHGAEKHGESHFSAVLRGSEKNKVRHRK